MEQNTCSEEVVSGMADRILAAWKDGEAIAIEKELSNAANLQVNGLNSFEMERMELLEGILQSLGQEFVPNDAQGYQVKVAVRLLEHLAARPVNLV